jgi:copper transport protein
LVVSTVVIVMLQGPYASSLPLVKMFDVNDSRAVLHTRLGHLSEIRLVLLVLALPLLVAVRRSRRPPLWWWVAATVVGIGIAATPGLAGHAATGIWTQFGVPLDTLHVLAMSVWLGGLASLALVVLDRAPDARRAAERFSPVALASVVLIVASGVFATWRQAGFTREAFFDTTFGRILVVKVGVFLGLLALAAWSRRIVRRARPVALSAAVAAESTTRLPQEPQPAEPDVRNLRWSVGGEILFGIAVLVLTSLLVNAQPARTVFEIPFSKELRQPNMLVDVIVDPAKAGPVTIHVYTLTPSGSTQYIVDATAQVSLPSKGIAPIDVPLKRAGPAHFQANDFTIPFSGQWLLVVRAYKTEIDETAVQTLVNIR